MEFPELVIEEAKALRKHATEQELNNLDFSGLDPNDKTECIYGQMTGNCFSKRAKELIELSCEKVYSNRDDCTIEECKLNGSPIGRFRSIIGGNVFSEKSYTSYYSPIEVFIAKNVSNDHPELNELLVKFLRGEIETLD